MPDTQRDYLPGRNKMVLNRATVMRAIEEYLNRRVTAVSNNVKVVDVDGEDRLGNTSNLFHLIIDIEPIDLGADE